MTTRPVETILEEWRTLERSLYDVVDARQRIDLERAVAALAEEHRAAVDGRLSEAVVLGSAPAPGVERAVVTDRQFRGA